MILEQNSLEVDPVDRHDVPRHDLKRVSKFKFIHSIFWCIFFFFGFVNGINIWLEILLGRAQTFILLMQVKS